MTTRPKVVAIIAHYSPENTCDDSFIDLVKSLSEVAERLVVVSTSQINNKERLGNNCEVIVRPNVGHDFYSYKVGLNQVWGRLEVGDLVVFVNSSIIISDRRLFNNAIRQCIAQASSGGAVSLTGSRQFGFHMQSYFVCLPVQLLRESAIVKFFNSIVPLRTKIDVIFSYEIGLTRAITSTGHSISVLFQPKFRDYLDVLRSLVGKRTKGIARIPSVKNLVNGINPVQFFPNQINERFGFAKRDVAGNLKLDIGRTIRLTPGSTPLIPKLPEVVAEFSRDENPLRSEAVAVVVHCHYPEITIELLQLLEDIPEVFSLIVTSSREDVIHAVLTHLPQNAGSVTVIRVENKGRDVLPFLIVSNLGLLESAVACLKIHTKKTAGRDYGEEWRKRIVAALMPSSLLIAEVIRRIKEDEFGLIGPKEYLLTNGKLFWGSNYRRVQELREELGLSTDNEDLRFFAGTMFWFKPSAICGIANAIDRFEFSEESAQMDGTDAHAIERLFIEAAESNGFPIGVINAEVEAANFSESASNRYPGFLQ